ncbi:MAG: hypothetical protein HY846_02525 [Nitrosomonadales bacterium]|nr:hypothetical protein [Nitrosomonadales bacterium]
MKYLTNAARLIIFAFSMCSVSHAATMDDYVTCFLVYSALLQAAKNAQHDGMLSYSKPRVQTVLPYIQENKDNPRAKEKLGETANRLENEIKDRFVMQATNAILAENPVNLKAAMPRVFQCDKAFGLSTLPLPLNTKQTHPYWNKFLQGMYGGCLAKQRKSPSPFSEAQIKGYCQCMMDHQAARGVDASSSEETTGRIIKESHSMCFASIQ